jgi:hypothetical protein
MENYFDEEEDFIILHHLKWALNRHIPFHHFYQLNRGGIEEGRSGKDPCYNLTLLPSCISTE